MERNTFRKIATVAALVLGLIPGLAASAHAQFTRQAGFTIFLPSPNDLVEITAGGSHTCVRKYDGRIYCWGDGRYGQLGNGAMEPRITPGLVPIP